MVARLSRERIRWDRYPYRAQSSIPLFLEVLTLRLAMRTVNPFPSGQDVSSTSASTSLRGKTPLIKEKEVQVFRGVLIVIHRIIEGKSNRAGFDSLAAKSI